MDYERLLQKYMWLISNAEGTDYLDHIGFGGIDVEFTAEEIVALKLASTASHRQREEYYEAWVAEHPRVVPRPGVQG